MSIREIVFDTETTGLSPADGHRVFDIALVELVNRIPTGNNFQQFMDPECEITAESTRITGVTNDQVQGQPTFAQMADQIMDFIGDSPLVAHNAGFDVSFMNAELERCGRAPLENEIVDTLQIAREKFPGSRHSLDALCKRFNVSLHDERDVHGALIDSLLLAEVYVELMGGLQGSFGIIAEEETAISTSTSAVHTSLKREKIILQPTADESKAHADFIANIKDSLWDAE